MSHGAASGGMTDGRFPGHAVAVALCTLLAACGTAPPEPVVPIAVPGAFSEDGGSPLPDRWWLIFGDGTLTALIDAALDANLDIETAWDRLQQAEATARKAGADLYPGVQASARAGYTVSAGGNAPDLMLGLAASWELDVWGRVRSVRDAATADALAARDGVQAAAITVAAEVATAWFQLVEQRAQLALLDRQIDVHERVLELVKLRFGAGQAGAEDMLRQQQLVEATRADRLRAETTAGVLEHRLALLLGRPPGETVTDDTATLVEPPALPSAGLPAELVDRRPDVRAARNALRAADLRVAAAVADQYPRLSLSVSASLSYEERVPFGIGWLANLAANLVAPLFDGWRREAEVERTEAVASEALHSWGQVMLEAFGEVEDALLRLRGDRELLESLDRQLELARAAVERARMAYARGAADYLRILDALQTEHALERTRLATHRDTLLHLVALCRGLAGGWELERDNDEEPAGSATAAGEGAGPEAGPGAEDPE